MTSIKIVKKNCPSVAAKTKFRVYPKHAYDVHDEKKGNGSWQLALPSEDLKMKHVSCFQLKTPKNQTDGKKSASPSKKMVLDSEACSQE